MRRAAGWSGVVLIGTALLGCSAVQPVRVPREDPAYEHVQVVHFRWRKPVYGNIPDFHLPEFYEKYDRFAPVETGGAAFFDADRTIFVGAAVGGLYCLRGRDGATVWRYDLDDPVGSVPAVDQDRAVVYFGADDGYLYAVRARSGRLVWKVDTGAPLRRTVWLRKDTLYAANADDGVIAVDAVSGEVVWRYHRPAPSGFTGLGYADLAFAGSLVLTGFSDGVVAALDRATGQVVWERDLGREARARAGANDVVLTDVDATPQVVGDTVVAASLAGGVFGLRVTDGAVLWTHPDVVDVTGAATLDAEVYLVASGTRGMLVVDPASGDIVRQRAFGLGIKRDPVVYDDLLLISDSEAGLYFVSGGTGRILNLLDMHGGFFSPAAVHGGMMVIMGNKSNVFAFGIH